MINLTTTDSPNNLVVSLYRTLPKEEQAIYALNDLLQKNYDADKGYMEAADNVKDSILIALFKNFAKQRQEFATEIKGRILELDREPAEDGSFSAYIHRTWMNIRKFFSEENRDLMIDECIRGEKTLLDDYEEALELTDIDVNQKTRTLLNKQKSEIERSINRLEELKNS